VLSLSLSRSQIMTSTRNMQFMTCPRLLLQDVGRATCGAHSRMKLATATHSGHYSVYVLHSSSGVNASGLRE
jgi:hypothetical protein